MSHAVVAIPGLDRIGGAERQIILLAKGLRRRGWRVSVVALSGRGRAAAGELGEAGVGFVSLGMRKGQTTWALMGFFSRRHGCISCRRVDSRSARQPDFRIDESGARALIPRRRDRAVKWT